MAHQPDPRSRSEGEVPALAAGADTIAAIATPPGRGGIGIVRLSGPRAGAIASKILGRIPAPRLAMLSGFLDAAGARIDEGIALFHPAPRSYTGEDVLELQGHGGPVVMRELLRRCVGLGARIAEPGEFTKRAFLNGRLDLAQAESVADLIDATSAEAARCAARSLAGEFSRRVSALGEAIADLRMHVEACIDFPDEEIDPADREAQAAKLAGARADLERLLAEAKQGAVLRDGLVVALVGRPNVGKSSLLNRLSGEELAIVTPIAGTTRDQVRSTILLEGVPIHLIDTAGLREPNDEVERIGIERAWSAARNAGATLYISEDGAGSSAEDERLAARLPGGMPLARVLNKIDLTGSPPGIDVEREGVVEIRVSAKTGSGVEALRQWLLQTAGWLPHGEGLFLARERHLEALRESGESLALAEKSTQAFEIYAENLRISHAALGRITGTMTADDLLGRIFGQFCVGK